MVKVTYLVAKGDVYKVVINTWVSFTNLYQLDSEKVKSGVVSYLNNNRPVYRSVIDSSYVLEEDKSLSEKEVDDLVAMDEIFKIKVIMDFKYGEGTEVEEFEDIKGLQEYMINYQSNNVGKKKWTWDDVVLAPEVEREIKKVVSTMKENKRIVEIGSKPIKGVMLEGEGGTGKTTIAKIIASELDAKFISANGGQFSELYVGSTSKNIKELFEKIDGKTVIFVDEIDALLGKRGGKDDKERSAGVNTWLAMMDGFDELEEVFFLGATNRIDLIDESALRGGRYEKHIHVGYPDYEGVVKLYELYLNKMKIEDNIDFKKLADLTGIVAPAQIEYICNEAGLYAVLEENKDIISQEDIEIIINRIFNKEKVKETRKIGFVTGVND